MKKKENTTKEILRKIYDYSLEYIMGDRFGRYSKYIIQDRAIPDVRDGLKPVQRRILYAMYIGHNTSDKAYRKSAKTVGDVIGSFHPHGDSSIYEAMVHLSQDWKMKNTLIDMHGNNGSIDGDSPAAYRYTEARLSKISNELLGDIDKNTVKFAPNFDDSVMEPTVLPAKFPNLLVNGTTGISAGYATNIPPHNLGEVIDATILRIDKPDSDIDDVLAIVKGPDFPTGGIAMDKDAIRTALSTGKGRVVVRSKVRIESEKNKTILIVDEIPYDIFKINIVKKIDEIRIDKKIDGILEVRDESDKEGLRIVIEVKKEANPEVILNYLYKNTDLQAAYNYNMVAIVNRRPKLLSVINIIDSYIAHLKEVILNRTKFDLDVSLKRFHIIEGLIKAISILDEVIATIRKSKNKSDAKDNLVKEYDFTVEQAEAIVMLQLYRLSNTDVTELKKEAEELSRKIETYRKILEDENALKYVMKKELINIKENYDIPRKTVISNETSEIKIDNEVLIPKEEVVVLATHDGYLKRTSLRSYSANTDEPLLKENDYVIGLYKMMTTDVLLLFTNLGNYLYVPVNDIFDIKWKVLGKHISNLIDISENETIIGAIPVSNFNKTINILLATKKGMIKKTSLCDFKVSRYSKPIACMKLKLGDEVISACLENNSEIMVSTNKGYSLWFDKDEVPVSGLKTSGVKSMNLKSDYIISFINFNKDLEYISVFTDKATAKRIKLDEFEKMSRSRRGLMILRDVKTNPYEVIKVFDTNIKDIFGIKTDKEIIEMKASEISISDRYKTGSTISKDSIIDVFKKTYLYDASSDNSNTEDSNIIDEKILEKEHLDKKISNNHQISLMEIDDELKKIDDMLN